MKEKRKDAGLTQRMLAELTGFPERNIQYWESKGAEVVPAGKLVRVARVLGCSVEELLS